MDQSFEALLASYNQQFKEAEEFGSDWMPEDGGYTVCISKVQSGAMKNDGGPDIPWFKPVLRIEDVGDAKLNGKEFPLGFLSMKVPGILKSVARQLNGGVPVADLPTTAQMILDSVGTYMNVSVKTKPDKKGVDRTNVYIEKILEVQDAEGDEAQEAMPDTH